MLQIELTPDVIRIPGHDWLGGDVVVGSRRLVVPMLLAPASRSPCTGVRILDRYILTVSTAHCPNLGGGQAWTSLKPRDFEPSAGLEYLASNADFDIGLYRSSFSLPGREIAAQFPDEVQLFGWGNGEELQYARFQALPGCGEPGVRRVQKANTYTYTEDGDSGGPAIDGEGRVCGLILGSKDGVVDLADLTYPAVRQWLLESGLPAEAFHPG